MASRRGKTTKRSKLEEDVGDTLEVYGFEYEVEKVAYMVPRVYTPDFTYGDTMIEVKGYFRPGDTQKYKAINDCWPERQLVFVLQNPLKRIRKGAKMTMADWCEKHDIPWYSADNLEALVVDILGVEDEND